MRSFNFSVSAQGNEPSPEYQAWSVGAQHFWVYQSTNLDSIFNITGFKNINIYKISVNGFVGSYAALGSSVIVSNWNWNIEVTGQNSVIGGDVSITPNGFGMSIQPINPIINLSKYTPYIEFATPIQSAKQIIFNGFYCDGIGAQILTNGQLNWAINCTVFYKYEGE
jgi:hypothetical protein